MTPGPALGMLLASIDFAAVDVADRVEVLRARQRQVSHDQAGLLADMYGIAEAVRAAGCVGRRGEGPIGEVAAALTYSTRRAALDLDLACTLIGHLPSVFTALQDGDVCWVKAVAFADWLADLNPEQAAAICADLLPLAPRLTAAQLRDRLRRRVLDIDPDHARRRYRDAVRERVVVAYLDDNGTVTISATGLPADEAAQACERLDQLARAVKRAGHRGVLSRIQADVFLGVLSGQFDHMTEPEIIAVLLAQHRPEDSDDTGDTGDTEQAESVGLIDLAECGGRSTTVDQPQSLAPGTGQAPRSAHPKPADQSSAQRETQFSEPAGQSKPTPDKTGAPARVVPFGVEIKVGLLTLLGLDERCAELPGYGFIPAHIARQTVTAQTRGGQWRCAITNDRGQLLFDGITARRPRPDIAATDPPGRCRRGIVELQLSSSELAALVDDDQHGWGRVITDIAEKYRSHCNPDPLTLSAGMTANARQHQRDKARLLRGAVARHVHIRDRTCVFPGCRRPARQAQLDHTIDHAHGGPTTADNADPLCTMHHAWKTLRWWRLTQPRPGQFRWTSPLGRVYYTHSQPIRLPTIPTRPRPKPPIRPVEHPLCEQSPIYRRAAPVRLGSTPTTTIDNSPPPF